MYAFSLYLSSCFLAAVPFFRMPQIGVCILCLGFFLSQVLAPTTGLKEASFFVVEHAERTSDIFHLILGGRSESLQRKPVFP